MTQPVDDSDEGLPRLILVDDEPLINESLGYVLHNDFSVSVADNRRAARILLRSMDAPPPLALVDLGLPPTPHVPDEGFALIEELLAFNPEMKILVLSGQSLEANIAHALTVGAADFIPKPCDPEVLRARLHHQLKILKAEQASSRRDPVPMLGESPVMGVMRDLIEQFSRSPFPVLIEGESGSGKELVAMDLHGAGAQLRVPLLTINCAAFSGELLEAQLFGHAKGAFTGADSARAGFFEEAGSGSLFLDEVGELPRALQSKLLRVLENGEYYRIGETRVRKSRARIIAATNQDLREAVRTGSFRQDLYHRLSVLTIRVPPLRERGADRRLLLEFFRDQYASLAAPFKLDANAERRWLDYAFPGNVRELRNIVIRLGAKFPGATVGLSELEGELEGEVACVAGIDVDETLDGALIARLQVPGFRLDEAVNQFERRYIDAALQVSGGNLSKAARLLGMNRTTLYSKIQRFALNGRDPEHTD